MPEVFLGILRGMIKLNHRDLRPRTIVSLPGVFQSPDLGTDFSLVFDFLPDPELCRSRMGIFLLLYSVSAELSRSHKAQRL